MLLLPPYNLIWLTPRLQRAKTNLPSPPVVNGRSEDNSYCEHMAILCVGFRHQPFVHLQIVLQMLGYTHFVFRPDEGKLKWESIGIER